MEKILYYLSALLCFLVMLAHEILGGPLVLPPLANTALPEEVIWLHHFSWHVGSIALVGVMSLYLYTARNPGNTTVAFISSATLGGFALLGISLATFGNSVLWSSPAPYIWIIISIAGFSGTYLERHKMKSTIHKD